VFENFDIWNCFGKMIDALLLAYIPMRVFSVRKPERRPWAVFALAFVVMSMILYSVDMVFKPVDFFITLVLHITLGMLYACSFYSGRFYLKMIVQSACVCCTMLIHFVVVMALSLYTGSMMMFTWEHITGAAILAFLLAHFMIRFSFTPKIDLPSQYGVSMAALMLTLALVTDVIRRGTIGGDSILWIQLSVNVVMAAIVLYLYFLFFSVIREYEEKKLLARQIDLQTKHLEETTETYSDMLQLRHELKNHVFYMNTLLEQKDYEKLTGFFNQVYRQEYTIDMIESGNHTINAILNQKVAYAKSKGIPVTVSAAVSETLNIDMSYVCAVISNLLDNSIEACELLPEPEISVSVRQKGKYIHITCKNTVAFDVLKENSELTTTKKTPHHGIGLQVVRNIVDSYDGMIDFYMEDLVFVVNVMLKT